jgi:hypothetical protein
VFSLNEHARPGFPPLFSFCKPISGEAVDDIVKSKAFYDRLYKQQFVEPLRKVVEDLKKSEEAQCSPIIEAFFDIITRREVSGNPGHTRLVFISDMGQNSPIYSVFQNPTCISPGTPRGDQRANVKNIEAFIETRRSYLGRDLSILILEYVPEGRTDNVREFIKRRWNEWFALMKIPVEWQLL